MRYLPAVPIALLYFTLACVSNKIAAVPLQLAAQESVSPPAAAVLPFLHAEHVYGFPDTKPNENGTLTLSAEALTFSGKSGSASVPRSSVTAVNAGNQRVEIWGMKGRILRMAIPEGGGLAAAAFMHHRVDMLTVEFTDGRGGKHGAVFFLPANEAGRALQSFIQTPVVPHKIAETSCQNVPIDANSVLVSSPGWDQAEVPAAYKTLVYEHVIDRLRRTKKAGHVYRDGQVGCPQYTLQISITVFKQGSQVKRAFMGPVGMFAGATQMVFDMTLNDTSGKMNYREQIKATIRGESESTNVADKVAKAVAKRYSSALNKADKSGTGKIEDTRTP